MTGNRVVGVEIANDFLSSLEGLAILFLFLKHFILISALLLLNEIQSLLDQIIQIFGLLVDCPSIFDFLGLKLEHVLLHHDIDLSISVNFHLHFLNLQSNWSLKVVLQFAYLFDVYSHFFDLCLDLLEAFDLFHCRPDHSFGNDSDETLCDAMILVCHVITNFLCFNLKETHLYLLDDFSSNLNLSFAIGLNFILNFLNVLVLILLNLLQFLLHIHQ